MDLRSLPDATPFSGRIEISAEDSDYVLRDDPTDSIANLAKDAPLSPQVVTALDGFVTK